jgi:hypothetical protein
MTTDMSSAFGVLPTTYDAHCAIIKAIAHVCQVKSAIVDLETNILQDNPTFQNQAAAVGPPRDAQFEAMVSLEQFNMSSLLIAWQGCFLWPSEEFRPEEVLGHRNFGGLDPIRKENNCVIDYDSSRSCFIVKGSTEDVHEALLRIKGVLCKAVAQHSAIQRLYLIQNECEEFTLTDHPLAMVHQAGTLLRQRMGKIVKSAEARPSLEDVALNAKRMKDLVIQTLSKVHWHQGHIELRVHLGTLLLERFEPFEGNSKTFAEFNEMVQDSHNFRAKVTEE